MLRDGCGFFGFLFCWFMGVLGVFGEDCLGVVVGGGRGSWCGVVGLGDFLKGDFVMNVCLLFVVVVLILLVFGVV